MLIALFATFLKYIFILLIHYIYYVNVFIIPNELKQGRRLSLKEKGYKVSLSYKNKL